MRNAAKSVRLLKLFIAVKNLIVEVLQCSSEDTGSGAAQVCHIKAPQRVCSPGVDIPGPRGPQPSWISSYLCLAHC